MLNKGISHEQKAVSSFLLRALMCVLLLSNEENQYHVTKNAKISSPIKTETEENDSASVCQ